MIIQDLMQFALLECNAARPWCSSREREVMATLSLFEQIPF